MKRAKAGDVFRLKYGDNEYYYGVYLGIYQTIFDYVDEGEGVLEEILASNALVTICMSKGTILSDFIERIGKVPRADSFMERIPKFYYYDQFVDRYWLSEDGGITKKEATKEECIGLMLFVVYSYNGVIDLISSFTSLQTSFFSLKYGPLRKEFKIYEYYGDVRSGRVLEKEPSDYLAG